MYTACSTRRRRDASAGERFLVYGLVGWTIDSLFVWLHTHRPRPSSLLNIPVYGLAQPLFEPLHDRIRDRPLALRAASYGIGILGLEYASGRILRRLRGSAPWDYGETRLGIDGLVRLDYLPLWALFGLGLERLHDALRPARGRFLASPSVAGLAASAGDRPRESNVREAARAERVMPRQVASARAPERDTGRARGGAGGIRRLTKGESMSTHEDELRERAEEAAYGAAEEEVPAEAPPQEQQQPHLQEAQHVREAEGTAREEASGEEPAR